MPCCSAQRSLSPASRSPPTPTRTSSSASRPKARSPTSRSPPRDRRRAELPRPGVTVELVEDAPSGQAVLDTGQAFFTGVAQRGPERAVKVQSLTQYARTFGERSGASLLY